MEETSPGDIGNHRQSSAIIDYFCSTSVSRDGLYYKNWQSLTIIDYFRFTSFSSDGLYYKNWQSLTIIDFFRFTSVFSDELITTISILEYQCSTTIPSDTFDFTNRQSSNISIIIRFLATTFITAIDNHRLFLL